jgi:hypothetical protein
VCLVTLAFHYNIDGIIFMWDVSSESTFHSIDPWLDCVKRNVIEANELLLRNGMPISGALFEPELLIVGNKTDKIGNDELERLRLSCPKHVLVVSFHKIVMFLKQCSFEVTPLRAEFPCHCD